MGNVLIAAGGAIAVGVAVTLGRLHIGRITARQAIAEAVAMPLEDHLAEVRADVEDAA